MKTALFILAFVLCSQFSFGQKTYKDSMTIFIEEYVKKHDVVSDEDKKLMNFYPVNQKYRVTAAFKETKDSKWFNMKTSGLFAQSFRVFGILTFSINDTVVKLNIYQSQDLMKIEEHKNLLFLPFTDLTSGEETYANGRYIDFHISDVVNNTLLIDFNKAYNPYCAYKPGFECPIPPKENTLGVAILAGEKIYNKKH